MDIRGPSYSVPICPLPCICIEFQVAKALRAAGAVKPAEVKLIAALLNILPYSAIPINRDLAVDIQVSPQLKAVQRFINRSQRFPVIIDVPVVGIKLVLAHHIAVGSVVGQQHVMVIGFYDLLAELPHHGIQRQRLQTGDVLLQQRLADRVQIGALLRRQRGAGRVVRHGGAPARQADGHRRGPGHQHGRKTAALLLRRRGVVAGYLVPRRGPLPRRRGELRPRRRKFRGCR